MTLSKLLRFWISHLQTGKTTQWGCQELSELVHVKVLNTPTLDTLLLLMFMYQNRFIYLTVSITSKIAFLLVSLKTGEKINFGGSV